MRRSFREAAVTNITFQEAGTLVLENLPSLVTFGPDELVVKWPSLEKVTVKDCPEICLGHVDISQFKTVDIELQGQQDVDTEIKIGRYFKLSDELSNIDKFEINDSEELSKILGKNLKPLHFTKLIQFQAKNCDERLNEFLSILLKRSEQLDHLVVEECRPLKLVFDLSKLVSEPDGRGNAEYFPYLKTMKLSDLPQLNWIWNKDPAGIFGLGHLENIEIMKCSSLKNLISASAAEKLQELRKLKLHSCGEVEEVIAVENEGVEAQNREIEFPLLSVLELTDLSNLIKFHRGNCALVFPSLSILKINKCPKMEAFTTGFASAEEPSTTDERSFTELSELELDGCDKLIYVIPSNILSRFQKLEKLTVRNCGSLKAIFPFHGEFHSAQSMLSKLTELVLTHLPNLEQVINKIFDSTTFFGKLQILRLKDCNSLKYLFLPFVAGSLMLRELEISDCMTLEEIYVTKGEDMTDKILFSHLESIALENLPMLSTFSPGTIEFPSLKTLRVENCPALKTFVSGFHKMKASSPNYYFLNSELLELEELILIKSETMLNVIPSRMLMRYKKLKKMTVEGCELLKEVYDLEKVIPDGNDKKMLPQLSELILNNLPCLTHVFNKEPQVPVFQNLESLQIVDCDELERLFSLSVANCLKKLKILKLYGCKNMKEVLFVDENGLTEVNSPMEGIKCLILKDLPSLVSFCGHSCNFKWNQLRTVRVSNIPKMETFSRENPDTPLLRTVYVTYIKKCWQGGLNDTITYLHNNPGEAESRMKFQSTVPLDAFGRLHSRKPSIPLCTVFPN